MEGYIWLDVESKTRPLRRAQITIVEYHLQCTTYPAIHYAAVPVTTPKTREGYLRWRYYENNQSFLKKVMEPPDVLICFKLKANSALQQCRLLEGSNQITHKLHI